MLTFSPISSGIVSNYDQSLWRINLLDVSNRNNIVYFAQHEKIFALKAFPCLTNDEMELHAELVSEIQSGRESPRPGYIITNAPFTVNHLKIGRIKGLECLFASRDNGIVSLYNTEANSKEVNFSKAIDPLQCLFEIDVRASSWGIDFYADKLLAAFSTNNHDIYVFDFNEYEALGSRNCDDLHSLIDLKEIKGLRYIDDLRSNIPSIAFDDTGTLLASLTIHSHVRIFDVITGNLLDELQLNHVGWNISFLSPQYFKTIECWTDLDNFNLLETFIALGYPPDTSMVQEFKSDAYYRNWLLDSKISHLILVTQTKHIVLLGGSLNDNMNIQDLAGVSPLFKNAGYEHSSDHLTDRINMVRIVPSLNCAVCGTQRGSIRIVHFVKVVHPKTNMVRYMLIHGKYLPTKIQAYISGMSVLERPDIGRTILIVLYATGVFELWDLTSCFTF